VKRVWTTARVRLVGVALFAVWLVFFSVIGRWTTPIRGAYYTRTTQVAANTELFVRNGVSIETHTFNEDVPLRIYDTPVYQALSALLAKGVGVGAELSGKLVSVLFVLGVIVVAVLVPLSAGVRLFFVAAFLASPAISFYAFNALPDVMCVSLVAVATLLFYSALDSGAKTAAVWLVPTCVFVAALVKPPTIAPFVGAIVVYLVLCGKSGRKPVRSLSGLAIGTFVVALVINRWIYVSVNGQNGAVSGHDLAWYFGTLDQRVDLRNYWELMTRLGKDALGVPIAFACLVAVVWAWRARRRPGVLFSYAAVFACLAYLLVFFNLCVVHSYYHMSVVPLMAAATGSFLTVERRPGSAAKALLWGSAVVALLWLPRREAFLRQRHHDDDAYVDAVAVRSIVPPDSHLVRVTRNDGDWDPSLHYWSRRFGRNVGRDRLTGFLERYGRHARSPWFLYVPRGLAASVDAQDLSRFAFKQLEQGVLLRIPVPH